MGEIDVQNLSYTYPGATSPILKDITFQVRESSRYLVVGPNLSGKTTLARVILREHLHQVDGLMTGNTALTFDRSKAPLIGFTFEDPAWMFCNLRVEDEVAFGLENIGIDRDEIRRRVDSVLELVGLSGFQGRAISTLSGGEQQKLAVAAALVSRPQIVITDDLLSNLDVVSSPHLSNLILGHAKATGGAWLDFSRQWRGDWRKSTQQAFIDDGIFTPISSVEDMMNMGEGRLGTQLPPELRVLAAVNAKLRLSGLPLIEGTDSEARILSQIANRFRLTSITGNRSVCDTHQSGNGMILDDIRFSYDGKSPVLNSVSLEFPISCVTVLAGRNGSGKSTLAKICAGLIEPTSGSISWDMKRTGGRSARKRVALVLQNPDYHFLSNTVADELRLSGDLLGLTTHELALQTENILTRSMLHDKVSVNPLSLSIGEKRRFAIFLALMRNPDMLIVDEPTLGQDDYQSSMLGALFRNLASDGVAVVVISHDAPFIFEFGDAICMLDAGNVRYQGAIPPLFLPDSPSDFAGTSLVASLWSQLAVSPKSHSSVPRSVDDLVRLLIPVSNAAA